MKALKYIKEEYINMKSIIFLLGLFIMAIDYNLFILPNSLVLGGASGLSIIINKLFNVPVVYTIATFNIILLILSFIILGTRAGKRSIIGSLVYPLFVSLTTPLATYLAPYVEFNNYLVTVLLAGCLFGVGTGLVFKGGYNSGGGDVLIMIVSKFMHITEGNASLISNGLLLLFGGMVFGVNIVVYSAVILIIISIIVDRILIGISDSKMFFISSKKYKKIEEYIMKELQTGVTLFNTEGAFKKTKREMLMVVVSTKDYSRIKEKILEIDNDAFFVVADCYEVNGGIKRKNLPFI